MAFPTANGLFVATFVDALDTTQLALDLDLETHKVAMFTNSVTGADYVTDTAYGVGYSAGGTALTGTTFVSSGAGVVKFSGDVTSWAASTIANARGCLIYADALAGNNGIAGVTFGADYSTTSGTFTIQWHASGIFTIDLIP